MPQAKQKKIPKNLIRAEIVPSSIDEEKRTIEVVFGTEALVRRYSWSKGTYLEQLSFNPSHVNMKRLQSGTAPFLDNHNYWGSVRSNTLGVILSAEIRDGKGYAVVKISKRSESMEEVWKDIVDGITKSVSVGYNVRTYEHTEREGQLDIYRATDWEPMEVSLVTIPADVDAYIRAATSEEAPFQLVNIISKSKNPDKMDKELMNQIRSLVGAANLPESFADGLVSRNVSLVDAQKEILLEVAKRAKTNEPTPPTPTPAPVSEKREGNVNEAVQAALVAERTRTTEIRNAVKTANLENSFGDDLVARGVTIDEARKEILAKWAEGNPPTSRGQQTGVKGEDVVDKRRKHMTDALLHRSGRLVNEKNETVVAVPEGARQYRNMTLHEMARHILEENGVDTRSMSRLQIAQEALVNKRMMATGDFPIILGNTVNRTLRSAYQLAERTFMPFTRRVNATDFRERTVTQLSGLMDGFDEVLEGGEYKRTKMTEAKEAWKVKKYGKVVPITFETIINDDLSAFDRIPSAIAAQAAQKQSDLIYGILTGNPTMGDGVTLFHSNHGNLGTASAITDASLAEARKKFRKQKGLNKKDFLNIMASYLIVGPDKETEAEKIMLGMILPNTVADVNRFSGKYQLIVEPRLEGNQWYMAANPSMIDTIEYGFLDGNELYTEQREGFDVDGMEFKVRMIFGAKAIDHRGLYKNAGA